MLFIRLTIGSDDYIIDTTDVIEIIPLVTLKELPGSDASVTGLLNYHGKSTPVIDMGALCEQATTSTTLTTRIILVRYQDKLLGLITDGVTETLRLEENDFKQTGIKVGNKEFLGDVVEYNNRFLQRIHIDQLLTDSIRNALFNDDSSKREAG